MKKMTVVLLLIVVLLLAACAPAAQPAQEAPTPVPTEEPMAEPTPEATAEPTEEPAPEPTVVVEEPIAAEDGAITVDELMNGTYSLETLEEPVTLVDGHWEGEPYAEGAASRPTVDLVDHSAFFADLDGDGVEDAVAFLVERGGGTGSFVYIAAQLNRDGRPVDAGTVWIDDRIQVKSVAISDGQIDLQIVVAGPGDGACCPSHLTNRSYALQDGVLAQVGGEEAELVKISAAGLVGSEWTLIELNDGQPLLDESEITLTFTEEGVAGFGSCNNYNATLTPGEENPNVIAIGPIGATRMACPDPIAQQETAYFTALEQVTQWSYWFGRLVVYYSADGSEYGRLLFDPVESGAAEATVGDALTGQTWQWVSFTSPVEQMAIPMPERYTLTFGEDGTLAVQADCNMASLPYTAQEGALTVEPGPMTLALCGPESMSEQFVTDLGFAARYFFQDGHLFIDMMADGGTLEFSPAAE